MTEEAAERSAGRRSRRSSAASGSDRPVPAPRRTLRPPKALVVINETVQLSVDAGADATTRMSSERPARPQHDRLTDDDIQASDLVAVVFLIAGGMTLSLPLEALQLPVRLPSWLIRFIGVAEVPGASGLVPPWLLRTRPVLTLWPPLA